MLNTEQVFEPNTMMSVHRGAGLTELNIVKASARSQDTGLAFCCDADVDKVAYFSSF